MGDFSLFEELNAVVKGIFRQRKGDGKRIGDTAVRHPEDAEHIFADVRLQVVKFGGSHDFGAHMVELGVMQKLLQFLHAVVVRREDGRTVFQIGNIQFIANLVHKGTSGSVKLCLICPRDGVIARVDHAGIAFAGTCAQIMPFFQNQHIEPVAGKLAGGRAADASRADNDDVIHSFSPCFKNVQ